MWLCGVPLAYGQMADNFLVAKALALAGRLIWGQFWGVDSSATPLPGGFVWNASISTPAYDSQVWSSAQE
jgi:hypothetical protein